jgi:hypothetical protein
MNRSHGMKIAAMLILSLTFLLWFVFSIIGMVRGVPREINNIVMIIILAVLGFLAWRRPLLGGILLAVFATLMAIYFLMFNDNFFTALVALALLCAPAVIAGLLFIEVDWSTRKKV